MELSDYPSLSSKKKYLKFSVSNFNEASVAWWLTSILKEDSNTIIYIGKDEKEISKGSQIGRVSSNPERKN